MHVLVKNIISKGFLEILFLSKRRTLELRMVFEMIINKDGALGQNFPDSSVAANQRLQAQRLQA